MEKGRGGKREGAGRPKIEENEKSKELCRKALKLIYKKDGDDDNTIAFLKAFAKTQRGMQFIAEHLLGKPIERIINHNFEGDQWPFDE